MSAGWRAEPGGRRRARVQRRRRLLAGGLLAGAVAGGAVALVLAGGGGGGSRASSHARLSHARGGQAAPAKGSAPRTAGRPRGAAPARGSFAVGLRVLRLRDASRSIALPDGAREPRPLLSYLRYPASGPVAGTDVPDAPPARAAGPFPLIVFGHGFAVTPSIYGRLLRSWAHAGYVVVAPVFPLGNADAPGGPEESDLINQPRDMSFLITRMLALSAARSGPLAGLIDPRRVAVSGQSDGGDTALALAYDEPLRDRRVGAAVILSGAEIPALGPFAFPAHGPPLLAVQGTADTINLPQETDSYFEAAGRPKFLLRLLGAEHLPPYTAEQPQLGIVERVTRAFLDSYLKHEAGAPSALASAARAAGSATILADP